MRLGIRGFNPQLRKAAERFASLRTPEGAPIPPNTLEELKRDTARLRLVSHQIKEVEESRLVRLQAASQTGPNAMVHLLARVLGIGVETADMLVHEVLSREWRDRRAVARYAGLAGSPGESGKKRREKGLSKSGNARVRRGMIQLAWRFLRFQHDGTVVSDARGGGSQDICKKMIVALARFIALWRLVTTGEVPAGVVLRAASSLPR